MTPSFWDAIGALITSPFMCFIFIVIIGAITCVSIIDRSNRRR